MKENKFSNTSIAIPCLYFNSVRCINNNSIEDYSRIPHLYTFHHFFTFHLRKHFQFERLVLKSIYFIPPENTLSTRVMPQQKRLAPEEF